MSISGYAEYALILYMFLTKKYSDHLNHLDLKYDETDH